MSAQAPLTEQQILQIVHSMYEGNIDYPDPADDDYLVRRNIANGAILKWDMFRGTLWNELWIPSSSAPDGEFTIALNKYTYKCPSDFRFISSYLRLVDANGNITFYKKIKPEDADLSDGQVCNKFYITGNARTGYFVNFLPGKSNTQFPASTDVGKTIKYEYYKRPAQFSDSGDIPEASNPNYFVHFILSYLFIQDDNLDASNRELGDAQDALNQMQTINSMSSWHQADEVKDGFLDESSGRGFGN